LTRRDALLVLGGALLAAAISALLFVAAAQRQPLGAGRLPGRPVQTERPIADVRRALPPPLRILAPIAPVQRGVSDAARGAAGLLLLLVLTAGTTVVARGQVVRVHAASAGPLLDQARVLGVGVGVILALASVAVLAWILILTTIVGRGPPFSTLALQVLVTALAVAALLMLGVTLVGFSAAAWRLGVLLLGLPAWRRWGERAPAAVAALLGAVLIYVLAQLPLAGGIVAAVVFAYSLGAFVLSRVAPAAASTVG
jgi:hypothetical protein